MQLQFWSHVTALGQDMALNTQESSVTLAADYMLHEHL